MLWREEVEGTHSPAFGARHCCLGHAPWYCPKSLLLYQGGHWKPGALPLIPACTLSIPHCPDSCPPFLLQDTPSQTSFLPSLGTAYSQVYTMTHVQHAPHPPTQPLRQHMPNHLLSAHPDSTCPSRLTSTHLLHCLSTVTELQLKKLRDLM